MSDTNEYDLTLDTLLEELAVEQPTSPYEKFFLLSNPFPAIGQFIPGICVDQNNVKREFARTLREFYLDGQSRRLTIIGRTGAGKTNLLKFFEQQLKEWRTPNTEHRSLTDLFTIFIDSPQGGYFEIHRQIVSQLGALFYPKFIETVYTDKINLNTLPAELSGINPELVRVLDRITISRSAVQMSFLGSTTQSYRALDNWLQGVKLSSAEKKELGNVTVEIGKSSTLAIKLLADLVRIFHYAQLFKGILILFDEFEQIFSGLSSSSQAQYAQDLRNLFDSLPQGVGFIIATSPVSKQLEQISPALNRRLGEGVLIEPVQNEDSALEYAQAYIQRGRKLFKDQMQRDIVLPSDCPEEDQPYYPLQRSTIIEIYRKLSEGQGDVVPGELLPELNLRLYRYIYEAN